MTKSTAFRTSITLRPRDKELLEQFADSLGLSTSGAVAAALQVAAEIKNEQEQGRKIQSTGADGDDRELKFIGTI